MHKLRSVLLIASGLMFIGFVFPPAPSQTAPIARLEPQQELALPPFTAVEIHNGVKAVLQHGTVQKVTLLEGSADISVVTVTEQRLIMDKCRGKCPPGYKLRVEIVTPLITAISVDNGGAIESRGDFPLYPALSLAVAHGGTIDARSVLSGTITASVNQGGRILAKPQSTMAATVSNGGVITYWGNAQVTSSTQHGGMVTKGAAADLGKPLSEVDALPTCPPNPPVPPAPSKRTRTVVI